MKKLIVYILVISLIGTATIPSTIGTTETKIQKSTPKTGGYIQGLIDNASAGDTIDIPAGIYYENIVINKSINLIGEDKYTTIIDGMDTWGAVIDIFAPWVNISGFTIENGGWYATGIHIHSNNCTIKDNIITNQMVVIRIYSNGNTLNQNTISGGSSCGIAIHNSSNNTITENNIISTSIASNHISIYNSKYNIISRNNISNLGGGIHIVNSSYNIISRNNISNNGYHGISLNQLSSDNVLNDNTISNNLMTGIHLENNPNNNTICNNTISNNQNGISISKSRHNTIINNNISYNTGQSINGFGIEIHDIYNTVRGNYITHNDIGLIIYSDNNTITFNSINTNKNDGILIYGDNNNISGNSIDFNKGQGIILKGANNNIISRNTIEANNDSGILIGFSWMGGIPPGKKIGSWSNIIKGNTILDNNHGIQLEYSSSNQIMKNTLMNNKESAFFNESYLNQWKQNYWNRPRILPKLIRGVQVIRGTGYPPSFIKYIPWFNIDWRPALKPLDIG
jgi:parallel beta-helix repeat protein